MNLRLSEPQRRLLARLPALPSDGARVKGPGKRTAQSLEAMGLARLVGASPVSTAHYYARTAEGNAAAGVDHNAMLARWADKLQERRAIEDFLAWAAAERNIHLADPRDVAVPVAELLDGYHGIDARVLDAARRALLDQSQKGGGA